MRLLRVLPLALLVAGCGGGGGTSSDRSAVDALRAAQRALAGLHSWHLTARSVTPKGTELIRADWAGRGEARVWLERGAERALTVETAGQGYIRANAEFWMADGHVPSRAATFLDGRWVAVGTGGSLARAMGEVSPGRMARCLTSGMGSVHSAGRAQIGGTPVQVLVADGDEPGGAPGRMYIAPSGLPLRMVQTGPQRPGGAPTVCNDSGTDHSTSGELRLSGFDRPVRITAPRGALTADQVRAALATAPVVPAA